MKKALLMVVATATLVGAVAPASAMSWNDYWWCAGQMIDTTRKPYCHSVEW